MAAIAAAHPDAGTNLREWVEGERRCLPYTRGGNVTGCGSRSGR